MHPRGRTTSPLASAWSSCTIAHQPTENGEAEPQSIERKRSQSFGTSNGGTMCLVPFQQSKNAPMATDQSPSNHARTSSLAARRPQPLLVRFNINVLVIVDPRRNEHSLEPGRLIADDPISEGSRINVTLPHP